MRPIVLRQTGTGSSLVAATDTYQSPFNVGIGIVVTGTVNYTIQHTFDDAINSAATAVWFNHPTLTAQAGSADGNYAFPVRGIRLTINSGTGTAIATVVQAGMPGK